MFEEFLTDIMSELNFLQEQESDPMANQLMNEQMFLIYAIMQRFSIMQEEGQSPEEFLAYLQGLEEVLAGEMAEARDEAHRRNVAKKQEYLQEIQQAFIRSAFPELASGQEGSGEKVGQDSLDQEKAFEEMAAENEQDQFFDGMAGGNEQSQFADDVTGEQDQILAILDELKSHTGSRWQAAELRAENYGFYLGYLTAVENLTGRKISFDEKAGRHYYPHL